MHLIWFRGASSGEARCFAENGTKAVKLLFSMLVHVEAAYGDNKIAILDAESG